VVAHTGPDVRAGQGGEDRLSMDGDVARLSVDLRDPAAARALIERTGRRWGPVDILVHVVAGDDAGAPDDGAPAHRPLEIAAGLVELVEPAMRARGRGCIALVLGALALDVSALGVGLHRRLQGSGVTALCLHAPDAAGAVATAEHLRQVALTMAGSDGPGRSPEGTRARLARAADRPPGPPSVAPTGRPRRQTVDPSDCQHSGGAAGHAREVA
jgi:hypothetical protein